jgi:hypothetical protein
MFSVVVAAERKQVLGAATIAAQKAVAQSYPQKHIVDRVEFNLHLSSKNVNLVLAKEIL